MILMDEGVVCKGNSSTCLCLIVILYILCVIEEMHQSQSLPMFLSLKQKCTANKITSVQINAKINIPFFI